MDAIKFYTSSLAKEDKEKISEISRNNVDSLIQDFYSMDHNSLKLIFSGHKFINHHDLNKRGLHILRMILADQNIQKRRDSLKLQECRESKQIIENGFLKVENFLKEDQFEELYKKVKDTVEKLPNDKFGKTSIQISNPQKFYENSSKILDIIKQVSGVDKFINDHRHGYPRTDIDYLLHEGGEQDLQYSIHSDIFYTSVKCWLYIEDVDEDNGAFCYVPKSHLNSFERLSWDYENSLIAADKSNKLYFQRMERNGVPGSFRICEGDKQGELKELKDKKFEDPISMVGKKNTLIVANTKGFHGRGRAEKGKKRIKIQSQYRINPFIIL